MRLVKQTSGVAFWVGSGLLGFMLVTAVLAPQIAPYDPNLPVEPASNKLQPPGGKHIFGTDLYGRDVLSRVMFGGRVSLFIAFSVTLLAILLGTGYGAVAGYAGGLADQALMRLTDLFLAFPMLFLLVTIIALLGQNLFWLMVFLALTGWMDIARLARAEVASLKARPFILRARASGLSRFRILRFHLFPNILPTVLAAAVLRMADIILVESTLSFLGLGVRPPMASWGAILNDGRRVLAQAWWLSFFPGLAIVATTLAIYLLGEAMKPQNRTTPATQANPN